MYAARREWKLNLNIDYSSLAARISIGRNMTWLKTDPRVWTVNKKTFT